MAVPSMAQGKLLKKGWEDCKSQNKSDMKQCFFFFLETATYKDKNN